MENTPKIVFVVGYANWGKSATLRELNNGERGWWQIGNRWFFIRRMSNDDKSAEYIVFIDSLDPATKPNVVAAFCPNFNNDEERTETVGILQRLRAKGYQLFFWMIEHQHGTPQVVAPATIAQLGAYGTTEVFTAQVEAAHRAAALEQFIVQRV